MKLTFFIYICNMKYYILLFCAFLLTSCGMGFGDDDAAQEVAVAWGDAYFNCDYHGADNYSTEESEKWLRLAASNTTEADLQLLRQNEAEVEADDYFPAASDTLRVVVLLVRNYLAPTVPGEEPRQEEEGLFQVTVVNRDGSWKVRMEGLPRSEKQSRD